MEGQSFRAVWSSIDEANDPTRFIRFMDEYGREDTDDPAAYRHLIDLIQPSIGDRVLEIGCGRGGAVRALARLVGPTGHVVGVDKSATMVAEARRRAKELGPSAEYRVGDAYRLPFPDATFDACYAEGLFELLDDPLRAIEQMTRVVKTGGRIVVSAPDYGTVVIDAGDRNVTRRLLNYFCDHETRGWVGRQLYGLARQTGLADVVILPRTVILRDYTWLQRLLMSSVWIGRAEAANALSSAEVAEWWADQDRRAQADTFFAAVTYFTVCGLKA